MRAVEITRPGGPEVLVPTERSVPEPASGEVLIKVSAAGVNRPDVLQRKGNYARRRAPDLPGLEVAGEIVGGDAAAGALPSATRSVPWWPAAGTPNTWWRRRRSACRFRAA